MALEKCVTPNFEEDMFINYAHDDNEVTIPTFSGWIDTMHESLLKRLTQLIGEKPKIWRDVRLGGNDVLTETILLRLSKTAFLVSILSPCYVNSTWCKDELKEFFQSASLNGGIKINNRSRIFKVVKTPIGNDPRIDPLEGSGLDPELRKLLQESLGYQFYEVDKQSGKFREFWPDRSADRDKFMEKLEDLAQDIQTFINSQKKASMDPSLQRCVYLAETTPELLDERNEIKRELLLRDYCVLPDENLPFDNAGFEEKVSAYLKRSSLSIHLIGSDHTVVPADGKERSNLNLMHRLAAERVSKQHEMAMDRGDSDAGYTRLLWMPEGLIAQEESYQRFLAYLQKDPGVYEGADVLCGTKLEDLKTIIKKRLKYSDEGRTGEGDRKRLYLICEKQDLPAVKQLRGYLEKEGKYEVLLPFEESSEVISGHKQNLRLCDVWLIFYGSTDSIDFKLRDFRRSDVIRDNKPLLAKGVYVSGPETEEKKAFCTDDALVMKNFGVFSPESIKPLLDQIEQSL